MGERKSRQELKTYFARNAVPTETNFADFVDAVLNQKDDGIVAPSEGNPLSIVAVGDEAGEKKLLNFCGSSDLKTSWTLSLNPLKIPDRTGSAEGFSISDGEGNSRLFIDRESGNVGVGTTNPGDYRLNVNGGLCASQRVCVKDGDCAFTFKPCRSAVRVHIQGTHLDHPGDRIVKIGDMELVRNGESQWRANFRNIRGLTLIVLDAGAYGTIGVAVNYDTYNDGHPEGDPDKLLADRLSEITPSQIGILTSFDAIHVGPKLQGQAGKLGLSVLLNLANRVGNACRVAYAAIFYGREDIKPIEVATSQKEYAIIQGYLSRYGFETAPESLAVLDSHDTRLMSLGCNGDLTIRGKVYSSSDIRLKEQPTRLPDALERLTQVRGVYFNWKDRPQESGRQLGVIAQEVEQVFPEAVSTDAQGCKSVAYGNLVAPLIEAVKTLKARVEALEAQAGKPQAPPPEE